MGEKDINRKKSKGANAERELVVKLWKLGFAVLRGPASGSKIKKGIYPDIVAIKNRHIFVFEVKKRTKLSHVYISKDQIEKIKEFARRAGGEPLVAVKISELQAWRAIPLTHIREVSPSKVRIDKEIIEQADDLLVYLNNKINTTLDSYIRK
ncbi:MAG: Holliday junction resolvase Hjc [Ignisphaera sp.]